MLNELPNEILLCIISQLSSHHVSTLLQTCRQFYSLKYDDDFWRCLVYNKYQITYRHPSFSWYQLALSKQVNQMCPHLYSPWLSASFHHYISQLTDIIQHNYHPSTSSICCDQSTSSFGICLYPHCHYLGCGDVFFKDKQQYSGHLYNHHKSTNHSLILKVSNINFLEMWCYSCNRPLGYWGTGNDKLKLASSEVYLVRKWIQSILWSVTIFSNNDNIVLYKQRQLEIQLLSSTSETPSYFLDSQWFFSWLKSLSLIENHQHDPQPDLILDDVSEEEDNNCYSSYSCSYPLSISPQHHLFLDQQTHLLKPNLKFSLHFVLVTCQIYCYIQRIYGIDGPTIHKDDLIGKPEYQSLLDQINEAID
ncbi:unnamed protein product [Cunninghamella blakesleeana]